MIKSDVTGTINEYLCLSPIESVRRRNEIMAITAEDLTRAAQLLDTLSEAYQSVFSDSKYKAILRHTPTYTRLLLSFRMPVVVTTALINHWTVIDRPTSHRVNGSW